MITTPDARLTRGGTFRHIFTVPEAVAKYTDMTAQLTRLGFFADLVVRLIPSTNFVEVSLADTAELPCGVYKFSLRYRIIADPNEVAHVDWKTLLVEKEVTAND